MSHPLFPTDLAEDPQAKDVQVERISISRNEAGKWVLVPRLFQAEELQSLEQIVEWYGGGLYELVARVTATGGKGRGGGGDRISARRRYQLPGRPKPLDGSEAEPEQPAAPAVVAPVVPPVAMGTDPMLALVIALIQQQGTVQVKAMESQTQIMAALITSMTSNKGSDTPALIEALSKFMPAPQKAGETTMLDLLRQGIELGKSVTPPAPAAPADDGGALVETIGAVVGGAVQGLGMLSQIEAEKTAQAQAQAAAAQAAAQAKGAPAVGGAPPPPQMTPGTPAGSEVGS